MGIENINWYPGHMKKTRELIQSNLKMVDVVVEIIDSRIPMSSRNPIIDECVDFIAECYDKAAGLLPASGLWCKGSSSFPLR